jgi:hypothetical protein
MMIHQCGIHQGKSLSSLILSVLVRFFLSPLAVDVASIYGAFGRRGFFSCELCIGIIEFCICIYFILRVYLLFMYELPHFLFVLHLFLGDCPFWSTCWLSTVVWHIPNNSFKCFRTTFKDPDYVDTPHHCYSFSHSKTTFTRSWYLWGIARAFPSHKWQSVCVNAKAKCRSDMCKLKNVTITNDL